ncbi:MAG: hypothetical protein QM605_16830 [Sphingobium sp.]
MTLFLSLGNHPPQNGASHRWKVKGQKGKANQRREDRRKSTSGKRIEAFANHSLAMIGFGYLRTSNLRHPSESWDLPSCNAVRHQKRSQLSLG